MECENKRMPNTFIVRKCAMCGDTFCVDERDYASYCPDCMAASKEFEDEFRVDYGGGLK